MEEFDILELIPQRPPFVMIDRLLYCDDNRTVTQLTIRQDNILLDGGALSEAGMMENMAQTCAAWIGYYNKCQHKKVKIGVIGGMKDIRIFQQPVMNSVIETKIEKAIENFFNNMMVFYATISCKDQIIAEGEMKVALLPPEK